MVGRTVTFRRGSKDKKPITMRIKSAKMLPEVADFGRIIQLHGRNMVYSVPVDHIDINNSLR